MNEIMVLLPAYNEEKNVEELTGKWQMYRSALKEKYSLELKIVVVNDGSMDGTKDVCISIEKKYDNFILVNHDSNKGLGMAVKTGMEYAVKNFSQSKYICIMDCDNTQDPEYIIPMLDKGRSTNADVVIASRYEKGADVRGIPKLRLLTSYGARFVYSALLNVKNVKDYTCGYRLYKTSAVKRLMERFKDNMIEESGFTCMAEILYKIYVCGCSFQEVPFQLRYDLKNGKSKMNVVKTSVNSIKLALRLRKLKAI